MKFVRHKVKFVRHLMKFVRHKVKLLGWSRSEVGKNIDTMLANRFVQVKNDRDVIIASYTYASLNELNRSANWNLSIAGSAIVKRNGTRSLRMQYRVFSITSYK